MSRCFVVIIMNLWISVVLAQSPDEMEAIMRLKGQTEYESLDSDVVEILHDLLQNPLPINAAGRSELEASGLFTPYQIVSLEDYIVRHGAVCSMTELACVDGFTEGIVGLLAPFIHIEPSASRIPARSRVFSGDIQARAGYKAYLDKDQSKQMYGLKSKISLAGKCVLNIAVTEPYDSSRWYPSVQTGNITWMHSRGKVVVGDFNARFGQGLCMWNTASFSSYASPASFMRRPSGISGSNSFTGTSALTGVASDFSFGRWMVTGLVSFPGIKAMNKSPDKLQLMPMLNLTRYGRSGHVSVTHKMSFSQFWMPTFRIPQMHTSLDASFCVKGVNVFGEVLQDWIGLKTSFLSGSEFGLGEKFRSAVLIRYLPLSNEHGLAASGEVKAGSHEFVGALDVVYHPEPKSKDSDESYQLKAQINWNYAVTASLLLKVKLSERIRTWGVLSRTEMRADLTYSYGNWKSTVRADLLYALEPACLGYIEAGYADSRLSAFLRYGMFAVDNWDDRIYVYERDAPGSFNVPAFYGRGLWTSVYLSWKYSRSGSLSLRGIYKKPGNAELKIQLGLRF